MATIFRKKGEHLERSEPRLIWTLPRGEGVRPIKQEFKVPVNNEMYNGTLQRDVHARAHEQLGMKPTQIKTADVGGFFGGGKDHYNDLSGSRNASWFATIPGALLALGTILLGAFNIIPAAAATGYTTAGILGGIGGVFSGLFTTGGLLLIPLAVLGVGYLLWRENSSPRPGYSD
ncbi:MAG: hypothetical protein AAB573_05525 [Patescibacteria group bacterium]